MGLLFGLAGRCSAGPGQCRGAVLAVATVEGCFLLLFLCTVSSVTGQCEGFSCGPVAVELGVHCGLCLGSMPLLIPPD